jgi:predicted AlkP superfamily pyrophosphatase or phosphodiesterase
MRRAALLALLWLLLVLSAAPREVFASPPHLVVLLFGDQFRYDYLTRFRQFYSGGLRYLLDRGAVFTDTHVGHVFGPDSGELLDTILRLDQQLADLIAFLGARVDLSRVLFVFTSDHGVAPIPETLSRRGFGGRVGGSLREAVEAGLARRFGHGNWIEARLPLQVYLNRELSRTRRIDPVRLEIEASALALGHPGVARVYTSRHLEGVSPREQDPWFIRFARGFDPERSGDLHVLLKPFWLFSSERGTTHGSPYEYDTLVPLILSGPGVRPGVYHQPGQIVDLAPTLAALLGVEFPTPREGRVLTEVLTGLPFQENQ